MAPDPRARLRAPLVARLPLRLSDVVPGDPDGPPDVRKIVPEVADLLWNPLRRHDLGDVSRGLHLMVAGAHLDLAPRRVECGAFPGCDQSRGVEASRFLDDLGEPPDALDIAAHGEIRDPRLQRSARPCCSRSRRSWPQSDVMTTSAPDARTFVMYGAKSCSR